MLTVKITSQEKRVHHRILINLLWQAYTSSDPPLIRSRAWFLLLSSRPPRYQEVSGRLWFNWRLQRSAAEWQQWASNQTETETATVGNEIIFAQQSLLWDVRECATYVLTLQVYCMRQQLFQGGGSLTEKENKNKIWYNTREEEKNCFHLTKVTRIVQMHKTVLFVWVQGALTSAFSIRSSRCSPTTSGWFLLLHIREVGIVYSVRWIIRTAATNFLDSCKKKW